ncbi:MAG: hypothetical protein AAF552_11000 [Pseudomonadota bacterium]
MNKRTQTVNTALLALLAAIAGCASTSERNMNAGERTLVSDEVAELVEELGEVDVRFAENVYCERIRRVGTHLVTRVCWDSREAARQSRQASDRYHRSMGNGTGCTLGTCAGEARGPLGGAEGSVRLPSLPN